MLALYTLLAIIAIVVIYEIVANDDEDNLLDIEMSNTEYEKRFIYAVSRIDRGNINWTIQYHRFFGMFTEDGHRIDKRVIL